MNALPQSATTAAMMAIASKGTELTPYERLFSHLVAMFWGWDKECGGMRAALDCETPEELVDYLIEIAVDNEQLAQGIGAAGLAVMGAGVR